MHELAIIRNVISIAEKEAQKGGFTRVLRINLSIGAASGIMSGCMVEFFHIAARGTVAEDAELSMETIPLTIRCDSCGFMGEPKGAKCSSCGSDIYKLVTGREFIVNSIEVE